MDYTFDNTVTGYRSEAGSPRRKRVREEMTEIEDRMEEAEGRKQRMNELHRDSYYFRGQ